MNEMINFFVTNAPVVFFVLVIGFGAGVFIVMQIINMKEGN